MQDADDMQNGCLPDSPQKHILQKSEVSSLMPLIQTVFPIILFLLFEHPGSGIRAQAGFTDSYMRNARSVLPAHPSLSAGSSGVCPSVSGMKCCPD